MPEELQLNYKKDMPLTMWKVKIVDDEREGTVHRALVLLLGHFNGRVGKKN